MGKRDDIKLAMKELICTKDIRQISMSDIFESANTGGGTFYNYWKTKDALMWEMFDDGVHKFLDTVIIKIDPFEKYKTVKPLFMAQVNNIIDYFTKSHKDVYSMFLLSNAIFRSEDAKRKLSDLNIERDILFKNIFTIGKEINEIIDINTISLTKMVMSVIIQLFIPNFFDEDLKVKLDDKEKELAKNGVWNMIKKEGE